MLLIVGGARLYNKETKKRECLGDVQAYNTIDQSWTELNCAGLLFERRRYHAVCMIGKLLLVYGGMNATQQCLGDMMVLALGKMNDREYRDRVYRWARVSTKGPSPQRVAYHTCQLVLNPERYRYADQINLYTSLPECASSYGARVLLHVLPPIRRRSRSRASTSLAAATRRVPRTLFMC